MDAAPWLLPGTGHCCKESSVLPALVLIASPSILPSYLYIFCTYYLAEHCNKHLHILALLGHLIEDHPILEDVLLKKVIKLFTLESFFPEHCNKHLHILALLGRLIEDHLILVEKVTKSSGWLSL